MSSGGGGGDFFENIFNEGLNTFTNVFSAGTLGFKNGGFQQGVATKAVYKGLKDVTGATAAEEANMLARQQFEKTAAQAEQDRLNAIQQNQNDQIRQSQLAGAARTSSRTTGRSSLLGGERDYLGL